MIKPPFEQSTKGKEKERASYDSLLSKYPRWSRELVASDKSRPADARNAVTQAKNQSKTQDKVREGKTTSRLQPITSDSLQPRGLLPSGALPCSQWPK